MSYSCQCGPGVEALPPVGPSISDNCGGGSQFLLFLTVLSAYLNKQCDISDPCRQPKRNIQPNFEYDYIVVGAGSAGSVVASRLSENGANKVLLIEAGGLEPTDLQVPSFFYSYLTTNVDWGYTNEPNNKSFMGSPNQRSRWPRGKVLGGTSSINGMLYLRGNPEDFDQWEQLGNAGWSYRDVLPYFRKAENHEQFDEVDAEFHGQGGPLSVQRPAIRTQFASDVLAASESVGIVPGDLNGRNATGIMVSDMTTKNGVRMSSARAYLRPNLQRKNLHILLDTQVTRLLLQARTNRAYGVLAVRNGRPIKVRARKEVILSAGNEQTPKLLLLSGIGPADQLRPWNITLRVDRPGVGRNLQNHVGVNLIWLAAALPAQQLNWDIANQYLNDRSGPLSTLGNLLNAKYASAYAPNASVPDVQIQIYDNFVTADAICQVSGDNQAGANRKLVLALPMVVKPKSRGYVGLSSADPLAPPRIFSNELSADEDVEVLLDGVRKSMEILESPVFAGYRLQLLRVQSGAAGQPCGGFDLRSDEYWRCKIRYDTVNCLHPVGTCRMGPRWDRNAVVDNKLRVYGVPGLRIIDASVMPTIVAGNTNAPVIMIGEKGADYILNNA